LAPNTAHARVLQRHCGKTL
jgi:hypothetical protein